MAMGDGSTDTGPVPDWFAAPLRRRLLRRGLCRLPQPLLDLLGRLPGTPGRLGVDAARWRGVRRRVPRAEWRRLTRSGYTVLYYHRLAGQGKPGQERLDLPPEVFDRQLALLRRLGFRPVAVDRLLAFHAGSGGSLPRRSYVVTADDAFRDCVAPLLRNADISPVVFVPTAEPGGRSWWAGDEPVAGWDELKALASAGVTIGSHSHRHIPLPELDCAHLPAELRQSRREAAAWLGHEPCLLAYPNGRRDGRVLEAAREAGFTLAFTTDPGRNGAGTDPLQLRRVGVKAWDSRLSFLWKALTGELLPPWWERRRISRAPRGYRPPPPSPHRGG
jgi:peptidoglycan/xylan/chitin deacetylase (PgdA/CDA1 family)